MVTFREVAQVAVGDNVTSAQMIQLAGAINDRIRSGLGDPTRRIHFYMQAMGRQIRNPDSGGTVGELNNKFFRFNGMEQWNRSMHVEATRHAVEFLREHKL